MLRYLLISLPDMSSGTSFRASNFMTAVPGLYWSITSGYLKALDLTRGSGVCLVLNELRKRKSELQGIKKKEKERNKTVIVTEVEESKARETSESNEK